MWEGLRQRGLGMPCLLQREKGIGAGAQAGAWQHHLELLPRPLGPNEAASIPLSAFQWNCPLRANNPHCISIN